MNDRIKNFLRYEYIRREGKYNMIVEASKVIADLRMPEQTYKTIISKYNEMKLEADIFKKKHPEQVEEYWDKIRQDVTDSRAEQYAAQILKDALSIPAPF